LLAGLLFAAVWHAVGLVGNTVSLAEDVDPRRVGRRVASGVFNAATDFGGRAAPTLDGVVGQLAGLDNAFRLLPCLAVAVCVLPTATVGRAVRPGLPAGSPAEPSRTGSPRAAATCDPGRRRSSHGMPTAYVEYGRCARRGIGADPPADRQGESMDDLRYDRLYRTASSEAYLLSDGEQPVARLELHFTDSNVYGLLLFEREPSEEEITAIIAQVDEDLVWTASVPREDFVVAVYTGRELGVFDDAARDRGNGDGTHNGGNGGH